MESRRFEISHPETEQENILSPEQLLEIGDPLELRKKLTEFLEESKDNESKLKELVEILSSMEEKMRSEENGGTSHSHIFNLEKIERAYGSTVVKKNRIHFADFLREYIRNSIKMFADKFSRYASAVEQNRAFKERKQKDRQEKETLKETIGEARTEIIQEMIDRMAAAAYSPQDRQKINDFENEIKRRNRHTDNEQKEFLNQVLEQEFILGKIFEEEKLFGKNVPVHHTDKFDDYFNRADLAAPIQEDFQILIDLTYSQSDAGEKLHYNSRHPIRNLNYPSNPEISEKFGLPIIIGMTETDAEESINLFLENTAKEKIDGENKELFLTNPDKNIDRWFQYVLTQLEYQRDFIQTGLEEKNKNREPADNFKMAVELYDKAISYFKELKKERHSRASLSEQRPWDKKLLSPYSVEETIEEFLIRSGREDKSRPTLEIPDLSSFAPK